ncbi:unnamed protein product [Trifolium pratense]|uniref:Uncharacterized protein n=1 Tax=Trifolium pratense TaxID=57577 RepID=A0ACB0M202_TRIPR|nr:unnamed protein product [Trifolium pratense]
MQQGSHGVQRRSVERQECREAYDCTGRKSEQRKENFSSVLDRGKEEQCKPGDGGKLGTKFKRYVSFYFTNFLPLHSNFFLRKGFEVCGMLEDVYLAKKTNRYGEPYGFVKFSNVKDVSKMMKALNAVWFGHYRVRASVAMFDRHYSGEGKRHEKRKVGLPKGAAEPLKKDDPKILTKPDLLGEGDVSTLRMEPKKQGGGHTHTDSDKDGVRVGDIVVKLGARRERGDRKEVSV